jgi:hypothetical protein
MPITKLQATFYIWLSTTSVSATVSINTRVQRNADSLDETFQDLNVLLWTQTKINLKNAVLIEI